MGNYNYYEAVAEDVRDYIEENGITLKDYEDADELKEFLRDELWAADSVTGNGSGTYTFSQWDAEQFLCHNWSLLQEAYAEFGYEGFPEDFTPENGDVVIRCYVLSDAIEKVVDEMKGATHE